MLLCCYMLLCRYAAMCYAAKLLCCYADMLLCCYAAMLLCCYAAKLLCCYAAMLPCCYAAMLLSCYMLLCCYTWSRSVISISLSPSYPHDLGSVLNKEEFYLFTFNEWKLIIIFFFLSTSNVPSTCFP